MFLVMDEMKIYCTTYYYDKRNCDRRNRGKGLVKNIIVKQINFKDILFNRFINYEINFAINTEDKYILQQYISNWIII